MGLEGRYIYADAGRCAGRGGGDSGLRRNDGYGAGGMMGLMVVGFGD